MKKLRYIEYNGQPVISARDLYAYLTEGNGNNVNAWLIYIEGHFITEEGKDFFKDESGQNIDLLLTAVCASIMCANFKTDKSKEAYIYLLGLTSTLSGL